MSELNQKSRDKCVSGVIMHCGIMMNLKSFNLSISYQLAHSLHIPAGMDEVSFSQSNSVRYLRVHSTLLSSDIFTATFLSLG